MKVMAMAESAAGSTGRIFISYRREETAYPAGWLYDRLAQHFGAAQILKTSTRSSWATTSSR